MKNKVNSLVDIIIAIALAAVSTYVRLSNPDMSETRLLITFWPFWLFMIAACLFIGYRINKRGE